MEKMGKKTVMMKKRRKMEESYKHSIMLNVMKYANVMISVSLANSS